jgi:hypothetical protein
MCYDETPKDMLEDLEPEAVFPETLSRSIGYCEQINVGWLA